MEHSGMATKVAGSLLLGAAIGGILGILFAPNKGSETRKKIMAGKDDLTDAMKDRVNRFINEVKTEFETAKEKAGHLIEGTPAKG
jgi:gas vesicle protein